MPGITVRTLTVLHRWLGRHPRTHSLLISMYDRVIGERRASRALLRLVRPGDCVWDVGANVGLYTRRFLDRVGPTGHVVAIEPVPAYVAQLHRLARPERLTVVPAALAASDGEAAFVVDGVASRIADGPGTISVRTRRGDALLSEGCPAPDLIKLDIEGAEGHALDGLTAALPRLRAVLVEVHFAILTRQGRPDEAARVLELLRRNGLKPRWVDSSHLLASR